MPIRNVSRTLVALGMLALTLAFAGTAGAASFTWNNAAGGAWSTAANWTPAGVPTTGDGVVLPVLGGAYDVTTDANVTLSDLTVSADATLRLGTGYKLTFVGSTIQNNGTIVIGPGTANYLYVSTDTEISGTGTLLLQSNGHIENPYARPQSRVRLINDAGHTIAGEGNVWVNLENHGTLAQLGTGSKLLTLWEYTYNYGTVSVRDGGHINVHIPLFKSFGGTIIGHNGSFTVDMSTTPDAYAYGPIDNLGGGSFVADGGDLDIVAGTVAGGTVYQTNGAGVVGFHNVGNPNNLIITAGAEVLLDGGTGFHIDSNSFENHGIVHVKGTLWLGGSQSDTVNTSSDGVIDLQGATIMGGRNMAGDTQTLLNAGTITGCGTIDGPFINAGTINIDCPVLAEVIASPRFINRGRITVSRGYLHAYGATSIRNIGVIDGGNGGIQVDQGGSIQNTGGVLLAGRSNVTLGARATAATIVGGTLGSSNGGYFVNAGQSTLQDVTLAKGSTFYTGIRAVTTATGASLISRGTLAVQTGGTLVAGTTTDLVQPEGTLLLQGGALNVPRGVRVQGALQGTGTFTGKLTNAGDMTPDVAGINVQGDYVQEKAGRLTMGVGGYTPDAFSHLTVSGAATLDGKLSMQPTGGFLPQAGHTFNVLTFGSSTGKFALVDASQGLLIDALYDAANVSLQTTAPAGVGGAGVPAALRFYARGMSFGLELPQQSEVTVAAYDVTGRQVAVLAQGVLPAGIHGYAMNARGLASGMYFARATLRTGGRTQVRDARLIVLK